MSDAHFTRIRKRPAAEQADVADGVMRVAERSRGDERLLRIQQAYDAVNLCGLNRFIERKRRNDRRNAFGQHRFAGPRRTNHQGVVAARDGDFDCAFYVALSFHIAEIDVVTLMCSEEFAQISACRQKRNFAAQKGERLPQILHAVDVDLIDHCGFKRVGFGNKQRALASSPCFQRNGQHAFHSTDRAVQGELTHEAEILKWRTVEFFGHGDHSKSNRQIEAWSLLFDVCRG